MTDKGVYIPGTNNEYEGVVLVDPATGNAYSAASGGSGGSGYTGAAATAPGTSGSTATPVGQNRGAYAQGQGDFADLARAGVGVMSPLPNSGTAPRMAIQHLGNAVGAVAGALTHGTEGLLAGEALSPVGPSILGRMLMSQPMQAYLGNQVLGGGGRPLTALDRLLLSNEARNAAPPVTQ